jgi:hypothetical protein
VTPVDDKKKRAATDTPSRDVASRAPRTIPWELLDVSALTRAKREVIGNSWRERMRQEHLAVGAFSLIAQELAGEGCDSVVLSLITRASADEVRHAEICRQMALVFLDEKRVPARFRGLPNIPRHASVSPRERVLFHVTEMCCINETITATHFAEIIRRTTNDGARAVMESLLEDEVDHSRVGWAYLASVGDEPLRASLARALPAMLDRTVGRIFATTSQCEPRDPAMEALAYMGNDASAELCRKTLHDVIFPGFETLGVNIDAARARARERTWI